MSSYTRDPISDATMVAPAHRPLPIITAPAYSKASTRVADMGDILLLTEAESPERRTARFRNLRLVWHQGGVLACSSCHFVPYYCVFCNGLKCRCKVAGVYRHWENGVPCASMEEQRLLDEVSL